jgi:hypothetical protein
MAKPSILFGVLLGVGLATVAMRPIVFQTSLLSPTQVVGRFCEMDSQGKQLTTQGWHEMAALFSEPGTPPATKVIVVKDFVVSRPEIMGNRAELYVEYVYLGQIDSAVGRFSSLPYVKVRSGFDLVRSENAAEWRIAVAPPESHITIAAALRYMTDIHDHATDSNTKRNAETAIAALKRLR